jgi:hypothetical protein
MGPVDSNPHRHGLAQVVEAPLATAIPLVSAETGGLVVPAAVLVVG